MKSDLCNCCLTKNCNKDLTTEYNHAGQKEIYSIMLKDTFGITISCDIQNRRLICENCIVTLRIAASFKKQVINAEETLSKVLRNLEFNNEAKNIEEVKEEHDDFHDRISDEIDHFDDYAVWNDNDLHGNDNSGQIFVIKLEPKENHDVKSLMNNNGRNKKNAKKSSTNRKSVKKKIADIKAKVKEKDKKTPKISQTLIDLKENSLKLFINSNMCLFKSLRTKFGCFICKESFLNITELRGHYKTHSNTNKLEFRLNYLRGLSYKNVDISNLTCKLCSNTCDDLAALKSHLAICHSIKFADAEHLLIPYKLENDCKCLVCGQEFNTFLRLSIHMNNHYKNNVCEICGVSYINRMSLRTHVQALHKEKKCSLCTATFVTTHSRVKHLRKVHGLGKSIRYCVLCGKTFRYTYLLNEHKIKEHGAKRPISECTECGKTFLSPLNLRTHVRSVHIKERNYPCSVCEMRFFTKCDQKRHERTHEDVRSFSCELCEGKFKSKDSWRRHLKRQHGRTNIK